MARIVPSDVVGYIDALLPDAADRQADPARARFGWGKERAGAYKGVVVLVRQVDDYLLPSGEQRVKLLAATSEIEAKLAIWSGGGSGTIEKTPGVGDANPLIVIRSVMSTLRDDAVPPGARRLSFVIDQDLREGLERDLASIEKHMHDEEWKAAMVIGASVAEALLLDAILRRHQSERQHAVTDLGDRGEIQNLNPDPLKWHLPQYAQVAKELGIIRVTTKTLLIASGDSRNLIHPGKALREAQQPTKASAYAVVAGMESVIADLTSG